MNTTLTLPDPKQARAYFEAKLAFTLGPYELDRRMRENQDLVIVDVRPEDDYVRGHIHGAIHLPQEKWSQPEGLQADRLHVVYCYDQFCQLAAMAARELAGQGFPVMELAGGFKAWKESELEVDRPGLNRLLGRKMFQDWPMPMFP